MKKVPYTIEEVDISDPQVWKTLVQLHCVTFPDDFILLPDEGDWFVAYQGDTPVAFASLTDHSGSATCIPPTSRRKTVEKQVAKMLSRCGVLRSHRGHGLQHKLVQARIEKAKQLGISTVYSTTYDNPASSNNLIKCGFRLFEPKKRWSMNGTNYWYLDLEK